MRFTHRPLLVGVLNVVSHPWKTLICAAIFLAAAVLLAALRLNISTNQNKLFDPNVKFFKDYLSFVRTFPENEAIYIVIEQADPRQAPPIARWTAIADAMTERLGAMPKYVASVDANVATEKLGSQGLLFDEPDNVRRNFAEVKRFIPLVQLWGEKPGVLTGLLGDTPIERFITGLRTQKPDAETISFVTLLAQSWNVAIENPAEPLRIGKNVPDLSAMDAADPSRLGYYYVRDERDRSRHLLLVRVFQRDDYSSLTGISEIVDSIRDAAKEVGRAYPEFSVGVTGRPALEADEMRTTDTDANRAEIIALIAVFIGLVVLLRSVWLAIAGELALGVGIGWTFGWATISIGELNLLSIVFLLALIGIGMDYLVQILTRYRMEVARRAQPRTVWIGVFHHVALPINTACMGAAGAFFVSVFTNFRGAAQLGVIAGGGLLLCLLAGYVVLPALLTIVPLKTKKRFRSQGGKPARGGWTSFILPVVWIILLLAGIPFALRTGFNPNLLAMQPPNLESVKLVNSLQTWSAAVVSKDLNQLRQAREAVKGAPTVARVESILTAYDNLAWLREHERELPKIEWAQPKAADANDLPRIAERARGLAAQFSSATTVPAAATSPASPYTSAAKSLEQFSQTLRDASGPRATEIAARLSAWQMAFVAELQGVLAPFHPQDLDVSKLPPELRNHYLGTDGSYALYLYPDEDCWIQAALRRFVHDVEQHVAKVPGEPTLTGIAINIYHSTSSIQNSFYKATIYALCLIFVLVFVDFWRVGQTLLAISVLALGLPMLVAIMGLVGVDWNFANFFGLPILIGAGHEYGVFLVHRYRETLHDPRRVWRRWDVSDRALLLCAYVTCTSFGFFWAIAHHQGLRSLGLVMALGTACIYFAAVFVLRPLLVWRLATLARRRAELSPQEQR